MPAMLKTLGPQYKSRRQKLDVQWSDLDNEFSTWKHKGTEIKNFIAPTYARFTGAEENQGQRKDYWIVDATATRSLRVAEAGMTTGITNPARPWFEMVTPDDDMMLFGPVKYWLHEARQRMLSVLLRSNFYQIAPRNYGYMFSFGTGCYLMERHPKRIVHFFPFPYGSYRIGTDRYGVPTHFMREFQMTVHKLVTTFGTYDQKTGKAEWEKFSQTVRSLWDSGNYQTRIDVRHAIVPNENWNPQYWLPKFKKYYSAYYEVGSGGKGRADWDIKDKFLKESGYDEWPIIATRWQTVGEDVYGSGQPGELVLGDVKQLQVQQKRKAQVTELHARPPMVAHPDLRAQGVGIIPGRTLWADETDGAKRYRSALDFNPDTRYLREDIAFTQAAIRSGMMEDMWLMISGRGANDPRKTAYEVAAQEQERLMVMGPTLHQCDVDQNDPLTTNLFKYMFQVGAIPPPPEELKGTQVEVRYVSILHQAMRALGLGGLERTTQFIGNLIPLYPELRHKYNPFEAAEHVGKMAGAPPKVLRSQEETDRLVEEERRAQAEMAQLQQAQIAADAGQKLASTELEGNNALSQILSQEQQQQGQLN